MFYLGLAAALTSVFFIAHLVFLLIHQGYIPLLPLWAATFVISTLPLFLNWLDRPYTATLLDQRRLNRLNVVLVIPVYNEDPFALDRCIYSAWNSARPPNIIHVHEDGPPKDPMVQAAYDRLHSYWTTQAGATRVFWTRSPVNEGKKAAQCHGFLAHRDADIFVTADSDTLLEYHCIEEALKPFADPGIAAVAAIEEVMNKRACWLTMVAAARNTLTQLVNWGTQSVFGDVLIVRGTAGFYRAQNVLEFIPAYLGETLLGVPVKLGDDSFLTLMSRMRGRVVQQTSAFCLPIYPETLSHHFRQWLRWSRGGSIRNYWRIRYLPKNSWGWWWTVMAYYFTFGSLFLPVFFIVEWPATDHLLAYLGLSVMVWTYATSVHVLRVQREGESALFRLGTVLAYPAGLLWSMYALRPVRLYGLFTPWKQGWVTRQAGVEVSAHRAAGYEQLMKDLERVG